MTAWTDHPPEPVGPARPFPGANTRAATGSLVQSDDGTPIAWQASGGTRRTLFVHSFPDASMWHLVLPHLPDDVGAVWMDRRGRGRSGRGEDYVDFDAEVDDVLAVAALLEPGAVLVAHSIGATIALETLRRDTTPFAGAVLYEPPLPVDDGPTPGRAEMLVALDEGRYEDAVEAWARKSVRLPEPAFEAFKASPAWPRAVEAIWTMRREGEALQRLGDEGRYAHVAIPVQLLMGTETPPHQVAAIRRLERELPNCRTVMLEGHGHSAHRTAPELVADAVVDFARHLPQRR